MERLPSTIPQLFFALLAGVLLASCSSEVKKQGIIALGDVNLAVPAEYRTTSSVPTTMGARSSLDLTNDALVVIPLSDIGLSAKPDLQNSRTTAIVYLMADANPLVVPSDAFDAWSLSGEFESAIIDAESEGNFFRIYSKHAYPSVWYVFRGRPSELGEQVDLADRWVADCRGVSATVRTSMQDAECLTYIRWNTLRVQISFPGFLIPQTSQLKERIAALIESWSIS